MDSQQQQYYHAIQYYDEHYHCGEVYFVALLFQQTQASHSRPVEPVPFAY
jgi:hypothetical protein